MKYMRQFGIIMLITCAGEILKYLIPLPVPAGIYGLCLMLFLLVTKIVKLEDVKDAGLFLVEIMPLMFIPAAVGLLESWGQLRPVLLPALTITVAVTFVVMVVSGKVTDAFLAGKQGRTDAGAEGSLQGREDARAEDSPLREVRKERGQHE